MARKIVRTEIEGLLRIDPLPSKSEINKLYSKDMASNADSYFWNEGAHVGYFKKKINLINKIYGKKGKILDVGSGVGYFLEEAKKSGWRETGIDVFEPANKAAIKNGLNVKKASLENANFPKNSFEAVTAFQTIEHERNPIKFLKEIYKVLKKGGMVVVTTPDHDCWVGRLMGKHWMGYKHPEHLYFLNEKSLRALLEMAGFFGIVIKRDDKRVYNLEYYFKRLADFFPNTPIKFLYSVVKRTVGKIPVSFFPNPWGDMIAIARK